MSDSSDRSTELEDARTAIEAAEKRLRGAIEASAGSRADKVLISKRLRAAFVRLNAARAKLEHLKDAVAEQRVNRARGALLEAEQDLDRAMHAPRVTANDESRWVSAAIESAFAKVTIAREVLNELIETTRRDDE